VTYDSQELDRARRMTTGAADILSELISRYASTKARDSSFADRVALLTTIVEISDLRFRVLQLERERDEAKKNAARTEQRLGLHLHHQRRKAK
jgi:hypothetical protein